MKNKLIILAILLLSLPGIFHLFAPGFFVSDDGEWMVIRFSAFYQAIADGQIPARFLHRLNFGYGYPVTNFLYPGLLYLGVPIKLLGFGFVDTIKILFGLSMAGSAAFTFLWLRKIFSNFAAFIAGVFYVYAPYHLYDLWVRGSGGELLALAVVPFSLWQIERKSIFWTTISIGFLIIAHNTLALLFLPILLTYIFIRFKEKNRIKFTISIVSLSLGLSAFFWFPAIFELSNVAFLSTTISSWSDYFPAFDLIALPIIVLFLVIFLLQFNFSRLKAYKLTVLFIVVTLISVLLSLKESSFLWGVLPVAFVQFPFRFLSIATISTSFLVAFSISRVPYSYKVALGAFLIFLSIFFSKGYIFPQEITNKGEGFYVTNEATTTVKDEYMPKWVFDKPSERYGEKVEIINGDGVIGSIVSDNKTISFETDNRSSITARINTIYYPGWVARINGQKADIKYSNEFGVMDIDVPRGKNKVVLTFRETIFRLIVDFISILTLTILLIWVNMNRFKLRK